MLKNVHDVILDTYYSITKCPQIDVRLVRAMECDYIKETKHFLVDPMSEEEMERIDRIIRKRWFCNHL